MYATETKIEWMNAMLDVRKDWAGSYVRALEDALEHYELTEFVDNDEDDELLASPATGLRAWVRIIAHPDENFAREWERRRGRVPGRVNSLLDMLVDAKRQRVMEEIWETKWGIVKITDIRFIYR